MARNSNFRLRIAGPGRVIDQLAAERTAAEERIEAARAAREAAREAARYRSVTARWLDGDKLAVRVTRGYDWNWREYVVDAESHTAGRLARLVGDEYGAPMFAVGGVTLPKQTLQAMGGAR